MRRAGHAADKPRTYPFGPAQNGLAPDLPGALDGAPPRAGGGRKMAAVALIVGTAVIGGIVLAGSRSPGRPVLAAAHALALGETIGPSDLTTVQVKTTGASVATIPASQRGAVLGERVTGPLAAGSILSPSSVAQGAQLPAGEVGLALALTPDQAAQGILSAGDAVVIVGQAPQAGSALATPLAVNAKAFNISPGPADSGKVIVDLVLTSPADASAVAAAATSTQGVRLVVVGLGVSH
jgi:hypothetical protein